MNIEFAKKKGQIIAAVVTAFIIIFVALHFRLYINSDTPHGVTLFVLSLLAAPVSGFLIIFKPSVNEKFKPLANTILFFLMPVLSIQMVEIFNGNYVWHFSVRTFLMNYLTYLVFYLVIFLISGRYHLSVLIFNIFLYFWSLLNYFIELFRGTPFVPLDIPTARTGISVADGYTYELSWKLILGSIMFLLIYLLNRHLKNLHLKKLKYKLITRLAPAAYLVIILCMFFFTDCAANMGYSPDFWNQYRGYHKTGSFFNFCLNTKYLFVNKPAGYDAENVSTYIDDTLEAYGVDPDSDVSVDILTGDIDYESSDTDDLPNIICIMNESLADLTRFDGLTTNTDPMPFIHSLTENTIKGNLYMPVFGAGTSNSEFEFLTGNSLSFLPAGSNVYQSYIKSEIPSLVSTLSSLGYSETALHPYYGDGWNREAVYPLLGFDNFISIEDFIDADILDTYKQNNNFSEYDALLKERYPGSDMLVRRFISDSYDYSMIEDMYENRDSSEPFFLFNVTMQNHGGYTASYSNFYQTVYTMNLSTLYPQANRYLSLVKKSDEAFEELVNYFSEVDEPTIICMFGDHLPALETAFYEEVLGNSLDDLDIEQEQSRYITPFIIWANYDIPEATIDYMSSNYLSTLLSQVAGLPMTQYNKYLATIYQSLPVINTVGYIDDNGVYYSSSGSSDYDDLLYEYNCIEYNALIDTKARDDSLFYLN